LLKVADTVVGAHKNAMRISHCADRGRGVDDARYMNEAGHPGEYLCFAGVVVVKVSWTTRNASTPLTVSIASIAFLVAQVKRLARVLRMRLEVELDALLLEHRDKLHHRVAPGGLAGLVGELSDAAVCRVPRSGEGPRPNSEFIVSTPISTAISTAILQ
jgi:hypothetical protein